MTLSKQAIDVLMTFLFFMMIAGIICVLYNAWDMNWTYGLSFNFIKSAVFTVLVGLLLLALSVVRSNLEVSKDRPSN